MLTPQEVSDRAFPKSSKGRGYDMSEVDEFLDVLTEDYSTLYKETAMLKSKMKVLADKINEYRSTEDAMRSTLLAAQKTANSIVQEAEEKKAKMLKDAEGTLREHVNSLKKSVAEEEARLLAAQNATAAFVAQVRRVANSQLESLDKLPDLTLAAQGAEKPTDPVQSAAEEIDSSLSKIMEDVPPAEGFDADTMATEEKAAQAADASAAEDEDDRFLQDTKRIDFDNLQFGRDYEVK